MTWQEEKKESNEGKEPIVGEAKYNVGQLIEHVFYKDIPGVILDVDPVFSEDEDIYQSLEDEMKPDRNQPFYRVLLSNYDDDAYVVYAAERNLLPSQRDFDNDPRLDMFFSGMKDGRYVSRQRMN